MHADPLKDIQYSNVIFDSAPIGMGISTFDGTLLKVNQAFCETIGYSEDEIVGKPFTVFTHPDDLDLNIRQNKRIIAGEISKHSLVKRYIHQSGRVIHAIMTVTGLVNREGKISYLLAQVVDITQRKEIEDARQKSEKEFRDIFENAPISIAKVNLEGRILNINRAFTENFGYTSGDLGKLSLEDISHPDDLRENIKLDKQLLSGKLDDFTMEKRYTRKNGETMHALLKVTLIRDEKESNFLGQNVDITRIKETEQELEQKNLSLEKINRELDEFVYRSSHDLKGPLTSIKGLVHLAKREDLSLPYEEQMTKSLDKLENVITDLVNFSQNMHNDIAYCEIEIEDFIEEIINEARNIFFDKKICFKLDRKNSGRIISDEKRLYIILQNILHNAIQYTDPEKPENCIDIRVLNKGDRFLIEVKDNGKGIPEQDLPKIFNMFYRGDESSEGSGLGLYIVKETLSKMGGDINIDSRLKKGTTVTLEIPNRMNEADCGKR